MVVGDTTYGSKYATAHTIPTPVCFSKCVPTARTLVARLGNFQRGRACEVATSASSLEVLECEEVGRCIEVASKVVAEPLNSAQSMIQPIYAKSMPYSSHPRREVCAHHEARPNCWICQVPRVPSGWNRPRAATRITSVIAAEEDLAQDSGTVQSGASKSAYSIHMRRRS